MRPRHAMPFFVLVLVANAALAQQTGTSGVPDKSGARRHEYWMVFQKNFRDSTTNATTLAVQASEKLELEVVIASQEDASGLVAIPGLGRQQPFSVRAGGMVRIGIDDDLQVRSSERVEKLAVVVTSTAPVVVYGSNRRYQTTDTYLAYPLEALGTRYRTAGYSMLAPDLVSQMAVVAPYDGTHVTIATTTRTLGGRGTGEPIAVTLNRGDVFQVLPDGSPNALPDLSGTLIEADRPVAVFSGHNCAYVPDVTTKGCNMLAEQLPPTGAWGTQFVVGPLGGRTSSAVRVFADQPGTEVYYDGTLAATLGAGEYHENRNLKAHAAITSSRPVQVVQYAKGYGNGDDVGDPTMIVVPPVSQFRSPYTFATPTSGSWKHYVNLVVAFADIESVLLDGRPVERSLFVAAGDYAVASIPVEPGVHGIGGGAAVGFYNYGFGVDENAYDAYGNAGSYTIEPSRR